ncbi:hypothetical protein ACWJJH_14550 [Endozoicomonadaceae bacterium StTr2]
MAAQQNFRLWSGWILCFFSGWIAHIQAEPASWENLHSPDYIRSRTDAVTAHYDHHLDNLRASGKTPEVGVLVTMFGMEDAAAESCAAGKQSNDLQKLTINTFPYWIDDGIVQLLFFTTSFDWDEKNLRHKTEKALLVELPEVADTSQWDILIKINSAVDRTVKGFAHSHIFIRHRSGMPFQTYQLIKDLPFSLKGVPPAGWPGLKYLSVKTKSDS